MHVHQPASLQYSMIEIKQMVGLLPPVARYFDPRKLGPSAGWEAIENQASNQQPAQVSEIQRVYPLLMHGFTLAVCMHASHTMFSFSTI